MKGGSKTTMMMMATFIWWSSMSAFGWASEVPLEASYSTVSFNTTFQDASVGFYQIFMRSLRMDLSSGTESYDIPVLRSKAAAVGDNQFVYVKLFNPKISITFAVYTLNAYVVAYQVDSSRRCYFFKEAPANSKSLLFRSCTSKVDVNLATNYVNLGDREKTKLGFKPLDQSLEEFQSFDSKDSTTSLRQNLLVVIQMVAEAARFKYIQKKIESNGFESGFLPKGDVISFENNWEVLSKAIQKSKDGKFATPIKLLNENYTPRSVSTVAEVENDMGLLLNAATTSFDDDQRAAM
ncbi:ribosome-inactivating protein cucurmosin-like [Humulus lupulus]|uniref:ribosome-inactivating protein cucurmosin-like n=1 Tax=Humulus lupulus TaxID=3486 RepID=UPI002B406219|nr:ribosome-inactivating protein cucurmosin-like [Humulus lupulus]XP_062076291.1 ribosome-inactivating protein cucurmosin-like [Humulus lupulus]